MFGEKFVKEFYFFENIKLNVINIRINPIPAIVSVNHQLTLKVKRNPTPKPNITTITRTIF